MLYKSEYFGVLSMPNDGYLMHHGVKGQKWGIRRYQNYDGSYTQAGLARYRTSEKAYNDAVGKYKDVKQQRKLGRASDYAVSNAKADVRRTKRQMNKDYKQLKYDKLADEGKQIYRSGKTITDNGYSRWRRRMLSATVGAMAVNAIRESNITRTYLGKNSGRVYKVPVSQIAAGALAAGIIGANVAKDYQEERQNKRLRAYYSHGRR